MDERFLVTDYSNCSDGEISHHDLRNLKYHPFNSAEDLLMFLSKAKESNMEICVYKLSDCLLDWS